MTIQFQPEHPMLRECSFFVLTEIKHPERDDLIRVSATATGPTHLGDAISRALFDQSSPRTEAEDFIVTSVLQTIAATDRWQINTLTGAPIDAHIGFDDGTSEIMVRIFALTNTGVPVTGEASGAGSLLINIVSRASENGNISFIGQASPETFKKLSVHAMTDETSSIMRLKPPGVEEGAMPEMRAFTDQIKTVELIYIDNDGALAGNLAIWKDADAETFHMDHGATIRITAPISTIFNLIQSTKANFVGFKITKE